MPVDLRISDAFADELRAQLGITPPVTPPTTPPTTPPITPPIVPPGTLSLPWGQGLLTRDVGGFGCEQTLVFAFTVPHDFINPGIGGISWAEFVDPPTLRFVTISRNPADFGPSSILAGGVGGIGMVRWSITPNGPDVALIAPGQTYYLNMRNTNVSGILACKRGASCNAIIQWNMP